MTTAYKSKDIDYMTKLKKAVLVGMRGSMPEEKEYTWEYIRKQVTIDDLQSFTVSKLGKLTSFPTKNFNGKVMAIFKDPPTAPERDILNKMMKQRAIPESDVYVTWLNKASAESPEEAEILKNTLNGEFITVKPRLVLAFGVSFTPDMHQVTDFKDAKIMVTYDMDWLFNAPQEEMPMRKQALWNDVVELTKHYNQN